MRLSIDELQRLLTKVADFYKISIQNSILGSLNNVVYIAATENRVIELLKMSKDALN